MCSVEPTGVNARQQWTSAQAGMGGVPKAGMQYQCKSPHSRSKGPRGNYIKVAKRKAPKFTAGQQGSVPLVKVRVQPAVQGQGSRQHRRAEQDANAWIPCSAHAQSGAHLQADA